MSAWTTLVGSSTMASGFGRDIARKRDGVQTREGFRIAASALLICVGYYLGARIGFMLRLPPATPSVLWPPNAILTAALLLTPPRRWWIYLLAALPAHLIVEVAARLPASLVLALFVTNCSEALLAAALVRQFSGGGTAFNTFRGLATFILCASLIAPFLSSFLDAGAMAVFRGENYWLDWRTRFFANVLTELTLVPPIVMIGSGQTAGVLPRPGRRLLEWGGLWLGLIIVGGIIFNWHPQSGTFVVLSHLPITVIMPFLYWAAVRLGPLATSLAVLTVEALAIWGGAGAWYLPSPAENVLSLQIILIVVTAPLLSLSGLMQERRQTRDAVRASEAFLSEGQRLGSTGSFSWRVDTDEITWSEQVYRIFEFDQAVPVTLELIGTRVHPEDIPLFYEMIDRARGDGNDFEYEHRLRMSDQSVKYLHVVAHGTRDQDGRLEYVGAIQDVTERRLSEEALSKVRSELAHVARATSLGALTASIAHEVSQPLSGIITNASACLRMLAADPPNVDGARETARRTIRDGTRASDVITRLRALFAKKEATTESVDLNEATREVVALSLSELQRNRVILQAELAVGLPLVTGDRVQLQQVILNLLLNASDAMTGVTDRPRQLVIRTERDEGHRVRLSVQDAGVGFEPQDVDRLFEAFYTTKSGGMGIGLCVSRSIIENHHGRLWAAPNAGLGATFSFSVPCAPGGVTGSDSFGTVRTPAVTYAEHCMRNS